jgi:hypothetical protein
MNCRCYFLSLQGLFRENLDLTVIIICFRWTAGCFVYTVGAFLQKPIGEGVWAIHSCRIRARWSILHPGALWTGMPLGSLDKRSTVHTWPCLQHLLALGWPINDTDKNHEGGTPLIQLWASPPHQPTTGRRGAWSHGGAAAGEPHPDTPITYFPTQNVIHDVRMAANIETRLTEHARQRREGSTAVQIAPVSNSWWPRLPRAPGLPYAPPTSPAFCPGSFRAASSMARAKTIHDDTLLPAAMGWGGHDVGTDGRGEGWVLTGCFTARGPLLMRHGAGPQQPGGDPGYEEHTGSVQARGRIWHGGAHLAMRPSAHDQDGVGVTCGPTGRWQAHRACGVCRVGPRGRKEAGRFRPSQQVHPSLFISGDPYIYFLLIHLLSYLGNYFQICNMCMQMIYLNKTPLCV